MTARVAPGAREALAEHPALEVRAQLLLDVPGQPGRRTSQLRAAGLSLRAVAATLASEGRVSRRGRRFLPAQIARMVAVRNKRVSPATQFEDS
jgi:hypothetical protein